jgi:DNA-binding NarL/FixJ family response regulator
MSETCSILIVDDHTLMREMLSERVASIPDLEVVGTAENADLAVKEAVRLQPDIILMDIDMPGLHCFDATRSIQARCPNTKIIILSAFFHDHYIEQALASEAAGYLTKNESVDTIIGAIRAVASGGSHFSPEVRARIVVDSRGARLAQKKRSRVSTLTNRELEVLRYVARGLSQKQVAEIMHLSVKTVHCHCTNLMTKLDIHDRVELTRFAIREGLAEA